ncbi:hypothetical protein [Chitinophaga sp. Cy-1792]|uniref:hypothetical protein n=1 Tax=Chitinophaga sp. Cy-1792 TaxID=2608339 RepID=UPI0014202B99|nr:hypothetical protein [Chitinophaga sp. Cy-1792]NIG55652.1 hypothetical protein [Chitinophaga sp. Cy-1792]
MHSVPMEESNLYQTVRKKFNVELSGPFGDRFEMKPAWKHAYYNAAKKNELGQVVLTESKLPWYGLMLISLFFGVLGLLKGHYPIPIGAGIVFVIAFLLAFFARQRSLIFDKTGVIASDILYKWEDFDGAYIVIAGVQKHPKSYLVFSRDEQPLVYINVSSYGDQSTVATPVRDFQPERYRASV